ncbi:MAG: hypothetical protein DIU54_008975 [Acidobacteriota bacterium]|jgi:hypothetical protein
MMSASRWWFAAFVVAVFLAGTSVGVIVDRVWLLPRPAGIGAGVGLRPAPAGRGATAGRGAVAAESLVDRNLRRMQARLELTDAQTEQVRPLLDAWLQRIAILQRTTREQLLDETRQLEQQLADVLTPEQLTRFSRGRGVLLVPSPGREGRFGPGRGAFRDENPGPRE